MCCISSDDVNVFKEYQTETEKNVNSPVIRHEEPFLLTFDILTVDLSSF
jgi:hypothetical protein